MSFKPRWQVEHEQRSGASGGRTMWKPGQVLGVPKGQRVARRAGRPWHRSRAVDIMLVLGAVGFFYFALYWALGQ